ncbi:hypothetical protein PPN52_13500 [Streptomyces sp. JCM 35825]|nr:MULTISPECIES: hypothetical protein [Streptomyces]WCL85530.1 hypothetical protein PPN52_13500 [Streptomyces sp. JCM 35825]
MRIQFGERPRCRVGPGEVHQYETATGAQYSVVSGEESTPAGRSEVEGGFQAVDAVDASRGEVHSCGLLAKAGQVGDREGDMGPVAEAFAGPLDLLGLDVGAQCVAGFFGQTCCGVAASAGGVQDDIPR